MKASTAAAAACRVQRSVIFTLVRRRRRRLTLRRILWSKATNDRDLQLCCRCWYFVAMSSLLCCFCTDNNTAHALNMETLKRLTFYRLKGSGGRRGVLGTGGWVGGWVGWWHVVLTSESAQESKACNGKHFNKDIKKTENTDRQSDRRGNENLIPHMNKCE